MRVAQLTKRPNEMFPVGLKYETPDLEEGSYVVSTVVTIKPDDASGLKTSGSPELDGDEVRQVIYDGENGKNYDVIFTTTTSEGNIFEDRIFIKVREI